MSVREKINGDFLYYFDQGKVTDAYQVFGAHLVKDEYGNMVACEFTLYAPNADHIYIIGEWNYYQEGQTEMFCIDSKGIWYARIEGNYEWKAYKYVIYTKNGQRLIKADPYAFYSAYRPAQDSKVYDIDGYCWNDQDWMFTHEKSYDKPLAIYEMHLGSWRKKPDGSFYTTAELAPMVVDYIKQYGFTHVEVMPAYEHPLDMSWGYQGTGYYSVSARWGVPKDFMYFVDLCHQNGIGVIMDWVPGHICRDAHGLYMFDGTPLYEYSKPEDRENVEWGTANLDLGKGTTRSFLFSNAMFYMNYFHVDGFRVDAVSNLIYWLGNCNRGVNEGACDFLRQCSRLIFGKDDRVLFMAEDSSAYGNVTKPVDFGGLGFNYKWDMGWMNDTLKYFKLDPIYRKYHHHQLTFSMMYFYSEQFCLPLSHDEVVHCKGSLLNKMPGDRWQQFANYRLLIGYMFTHPGKKLLFMGDELSTYDEWHYESELAWNIRQYPDHDAAARFVRDMTLVYKYHAPLWQQDYSTNGFYWIQADNAEQSLYVFARVANDPKDQLVIVMNCTPNTYDNYRIGVPEADEYEEVINSDKDIYGGSNRINPFNLKVENYGQDNQAHSVLMTIPPLGISILKPIYKPKPKDEVKVEATVEVKEEPKEAKKTTKKPTTKKASATKAPAKKATTKKKTA